MAKKEKKRNNIPPADLPDHALPQNILLIGERVEEDKNIYISQAVYKEIRKFTKNKTTDESGGILLGSVIEEFSKTNIVISGFVEAKFCEATPSTLKFTHETWEYVHREIDKKHGEKKIVGWIHTHPDFGIFLSEYDKFIHQNFFSEPHQIAYVVDPIQHIEGFYFWIHGSIEKCKGFYIYDKTGTQITVNAGKDESGSAMPERSPFSVKNILLAILSVAVALLVFSNISTNNKMKQLENNQQILETQLLTLSNSANQVLYQMQQMIAAQDEEIQDVNTILTEAGMIPSEANGESGEPNEGAETGNE